MERIRALVVDDSAFMRKLISRILGEGGVEVVGAARDGAEAVKMVLELKPDVVTLDVEMPRMGGLEALQAIMRGRPTPCIMLSAFTPRGADATLKALEAGAFDFVQKPSGSISLDLEKVGAELLAKIRAAHRVNLELLALKAAPAPPAPAVAAAEPAALQPSSAVREVVLIAASTGGPRALAELIPALPGGLSAAVLVVQHMSAGFTKSLAARLDGASALGVREAQEGDLLANGQALLAPGDWHMTLKASPEGWRVALDQRPQQQGVRPAADPLFISAAKAFGPHCLAVVMTGMGRDGTKGLKAVKAAGGRSLAQDEASCVVYGMPRHAIEAGLADAVLPLSGLAGAIAAQIQS